MTGLEALRQTGLWDGRSRGALMEWKMVLMNAVRLGLIRPVAVGRFLFTDQFFQAVEQEFGGGGGSGGGGDGGDGGEYADGW